MTPRRLTASPPSAVGEVGERSEPGGGASYENPSPNPSPKKGGERDTNWPLAPPSFSGKGAGGLGSATPPPSRLPLLLAGLVTAVGVGWRLVDLTEWPFPYNPTVQYESAMVARAVWVALDPAARTPDRAAWFEAHGFRHVISPPVLPALVAGCYAIAGDEIPWAAKAVAAAVWVGAGWLIGLAVVRQTGSRWAGVVGLAWFVLCPFGLVVSRSFQAEPVLVFGFALAAWHLSRPGAAAGWRAAVVSGLVCGLAALAKPGTLLAPLTAGFAALVLSPGVAGGWLSKVGRLAAFAALVAAPSMAYTTFVVPGHGGKVQPELWTDLGSYEAALGLARAAVGLPALGLGLLGVGLAARAGNFLPLGLGIGYVGYMVLILYHAATHDYYHTALLVVVALGLGWAAAGFGRFMPKGVRCPDRVLAVLAVLGIAGYVWVSRVPYVGPWRYAPAMRSVINDVALRDRARAARYAAIEQTVGGGGRVVALTEDYNFPLMYHTSLRVAGWHYRADTALMVRTGGFDPAAAADERLARLVAEGNSHFAVTDFEEFTAQSDLQAALDRRGRVVVSQPGLLVYDLRRE